PARQRSCTDCILPCVSFTADARIVRDSGRPLAQREAALLRCVRPFAPFGLLGTLGYLDRTASGRDTSERLASAIDILSAARSAWLIEVSRFAQERRVAKERGARRITSAEIERYASFGWPGDATGETAGQALDSTFLRAYGLTPWVPAPVNL